MVGLVGDLTLIASELVTNAVEHTRDDREIRVRFTREPGAVLLAVWDSSDARPVRKRPVGGVARDAAPDAEALNPGHEDGTGGRGLAIVEALSTEWGVTRTDPVGKWVWSRVADGVRG
ncbi:ATP-binding protein [Actinomadura sp. KC345]|uniref:ATP-binding protein n=1 Tax=Actinomadura sp. KC345 TaxID=2530371 RepID=UPI001405551D|nr:ATP-binding protein [Actinomadura sp. KC345]